MKTRLKNTEDIKKKKLIKTAVLAAVGIILFAGGLYALQWSGTYDVKAPPPWQLHDLQKLGKIIDDHLHIKGLEEADQLVPIMDKMGIKKCVLEGSSKFTLTLNERDGFTEYDNNNEELLKIVKKYPGRFEAWVTVNPLDNDKLEKFKDQVSRGATGLKLYLGHGFISKKTGEYFFHTMAIDDPRMYPLYQYCQENNIPVCLHVNPGPTRPGFAQEFIEILNRYPDLKVVCPHFMLSSIKRSRLREYLDTYPNLYTDISYGYVDYFKDGLKRMSKEHEEFRQLFLDYPDRIFYATDEVVTPVKLHTPWFMESRFQGYFDVLAKRQWTSDFVDKGKVLNGLALPRDLLEKVLWKNYEAFVAKKPQGTVITREINWDNMSTTYYARQPGQTFPPPRQKAPKKKFKRNKNARKKKSN